MRSSASPWTDSHERNEGEEFVDIETFDDDDSAMMLVDDDGGDEKNHHHAVDEPGEKEFAEFRALALKSWDNDNVREMVDCLQRSSDLGHREALRELVNFRHHWSDRLSDVRPPSEEEVRRCIERFPEDTSLDYLLALVLERQGDRAGEFRAYRQCYAKGAVYALPQMARLIIESAHRPEELQLDDDEHDVALAVQWLHEACDLDHFEGYLFLGALQNCPQSILHHNPKEAKWNLRAAKEVLARDVSREMGRATEKIDRLAVRHWAQHTSNEINQQLKLWQSFQEDGMTPGE